MLTINHDLEQLLTDNTGHDHGCWETFADKALEAWAAREGLDIDNLPIAGRHDDKIDGLTLWEMYTLQVLVHERECYCEDPGDE